jgi:hypothetical protein
MSLHTSVARTAHPQWQQAGSREDTTIQFIKLVKKFLAFYKTRRFITAFARALRLPLSWVRWLPRSVFLTATVCLILRWWSQIMKLLTTQVLSSLLLLPHNPSSDSHAALEALQGVKLRPLWYSSAKTCWIIFRLTAPWDSSKSQEILV